MNEVFYITSHDILNARIQGAFLLKAILEILKSLIVDRLRSMLMRCSGNIQDLADVSQPKPPFPQGPLSQRIPDN
ncbi:MAG: hypothetical protein K6E38_08720 [Fretibacterium sp.]|nr:hypothetical protein [Fretibacterium sp.]